MSVYCLYIILIQDSLLHTINSANVLSVPIKSTNLRLMFEDTVNKLPTAKIKGNILFACSW